MRRLIAGLLVLLAAERIDAQETAVVAMPLTPDLVEAYHEYAVARHNLIYYRQVTAPMKRQAVAAAMDRTRRDIAVLDRRLRSYAPVLLAGEFTPADTAAENDWLVRRQAAERLSYLQDQDIALMRLQGSTDELYQYEVLRAALRVRAAHAALEY